MCVCVCSQEYERALKYIDAVTHIEPANHQARQLHNYIKKKMEKGNWESVAQSKSTHSQKPQLGMIERGHHCVLGLAPALRFLWSPILCWLYKSPSTMSPVCMYICMQKDHICTLKIMQSMSEFSGLWKQQNNPACTKRCRSLHHV